METDSCSHRLEAPEKYVCIRKMPAFAWNGIRNYIKNSWEDRIDLWEGKFKLSAKRFSDYTRMRAHAHKHTYLVLFKKFGNIRHELIFLDNVPA